MRLRVFAVMLVFSCRGQSHTTDSGVPSTHVDSGAYQSKPVGPALRDPNDLHPIRIDGKYGYFDQTGAVAIEPQFDLARHFSEGLAAASVGDLWGYINADGRFVVPPKFGYAFEFSGGLAGVELSKDRYGFIDATGRVVIEPRFSFPGEFHAGVAPVVVPADGKGKGRSAALINRVGEIVAGGFDSIAEYESGSFGACLPKSAKGGGSARCGRIAADGVWVVPPTYDSAWPPTNGVVSGCTSERHCGLFSLDGGSVGAGINALLIGPETEGLYAVGLPTKPPRFGFLDSSGAFRINPIFDYVAPFREGVAAAVQTGRLGFLGTDGEWVIPPTLEVGSMFTKADLDWGVIDGWAWMEANTREGSNFHRGVAHVTTNEGGTRTTVHLDSSGRILRIEPLHSGDWRYLPDVDKKAATTGQSEKQNRTGTAFLVSSSGQVVTSAHVVDGCTHVWIETPRAEARVASIDRANDLALLETLPAVWQGTKPIHIASETPRVGERAFVFGFPFTGLLATGGTFTEGSISARSGIGNNSALLQISAPLQPGNSGGAVLDQRGRVVGVVASKLDALKVAALVGDVPQNVNFAVKASVLREFLWAANVDVGGATDVGVLESSAIAEIARMASTRIRCE